MLKQILPKEINIVKILSPSNSHKMLERTADLVKTLDDK